jgi:RNA polymerase sigma-70 factor, ECF subfamily
MVQTKEQPPAKQDLAERDLVEQARRDRQAFGVLYDRYVDQIYTFAYRQTNDDALAKDITAITFEKALRHLNRYQWQGTAFIAWLYRIARNEIIQHHRRQRWLAPLRGWLISASNVEKTAQSHEQQDAVQVALQRLPDRDREVIILRFFEDLTSAEVAEVLGCSTTNVYVKLHRALTRLRRELEAGQTAVASSPAETERKSYVSKKV